EGSFAIDVPVSWTDSPPPSFAGVIQFQACNDTQCLPPASVHFEAGHVASQASSSLAGGAVALSQAPRNAAPKSSAPGASNDFADLLARRGLAVSLLIVFGWGLALNLTPCVYPVIPLTVSFFGGQAPGNTRRVFGLAALYVLGMATMYSA